MQKSMCYKIIFLFILLFCLPCCGPTVKLSPELSANKSKIMLALAPIEKPADIRNERSDLFRSTLEAKLKGKGYYLLERSIVNEICINAKCENKSKLFEQYKIGALLSINLDSPSETNWGIISYNSLSGKAKLEDLTGKSLYQASATSSKSGGLILQSGQILRAIRDIFTNSADQTFANLSSKLVNDLIESLPDQEYSTADEYPSVIESVNKWPINSDFYKICLQGTPNSLASIVRNRERMTLREISIGTYCGSVYRGTTGDETINLELRSPYGIQALSQIGL